MVLFDQNIQNTATARLELELDLTRALEQEQFFLLYQPILSLEDKACPKAWRR